MRHLGFKVLRFEKGNAIPYGPWHSSPEEARAFLKDQATVENNEEGIVFWIVELRALAEIRKTLTWKIPV